MTTVYGIPLSPFVRKVLYVLVHNGVEHNVEPVTPMELPEDFHKISPLGKIPAFSDDDLTISDSSVICHYLDSKYGEPADQSLFPKNLVERAHAAWFEEYADTKLVELMGGLFFQRVINPKFLQIETDEARVEEILTELLPPALDYLETQVPESGFLFGDQPMLADIALASPFVNAMYAQYQVDTSRWPKVASYVKRNLATPVCQKLLDAEKAILAG